MDLSSESIFILIFLLVSFLSWLSEKIRRASANRQEVEPPSERSQSEERPVPEIRQESQRPTSHSSPSDTMRDILQSLGAFVEAVGRNEPEPPLTRGGDLRAPSAHRPVGDSFTQ